MLVLCIAFIFITIIRSQCFWFFWVNQSHFFSRPIWRGSRLHFIQAAKNMISTRTQIYFKFYFCGCKKHSEFITVGIIFVMRHLKPATDSNCYVEVCYWDPSLRMNHSWVYTVTFKVFNRRTLKMTPYMPRSGPFTQFWLKRKLWDAKCSPVNYSMLLASVNMKAQRF